MRRGFGKCWTILFDGVMFLAALTLLCRVWAASSSSDADDVPASFVASGATTDATPSPSSAASTSFPPLASRISPSRRPPPTAFASRIARTSPPFETHDGGDVPGSLSFVEREDRAGQRGARVRVGVDADADARARRASRRGVASTTPRRVAAPVVAASTSRRGVKPHRRDEPSDEHLSLSKIHRHRRARGVVFHPPAVPLTAAPSLSRARVRVRGEQHDVTRASGRSRRTSWRRV